MRGTEGDFRCSVILIIDKSYLSKDDDAHPLVVHVGCYVLNGRQGKFYEIQTQKTQLFFFGI
jgi:hypothetical protein